jgi:predicted  nucleic acid-binding Zn-ribbon protein
MSAAKREPVDSIEKLAVLMADGFERVDARFDTIDTRFDAIDGRLDSINARLRYIENELVDIHRRLDRLEEQGASNAGFAKEIDNLIERVNAIERHLNIRPA